MLNFIFKNNQQKELWKALEGKNYLSREQFNQAVQTAERENRHITEVLFEDENLPKEKLLQSFSQAYNAPAVLLKEKVISPEVLKLIPKEVAEQHQVIVFKKIKNIINVALINPENVQTLEFIKKKTGFDPVVFITTPEDIEYALKKYKSEIKAEFKKIIHDSTKETLAIHETAEKMAQHVPTIKMVNTIIEQALGSNASDIHLEPSTDKITVRFRVDGLLKKIVDLPKEVLPPLVTRIKLLANLKIDEHRLPQDGRFKFTYKEREVAIRVSAIPTLHGTKIVMRLLDIKEKPFTLLSLGLNSKDLKTVKREITKPQGLILVTGPTGSGKTTTLYSILRMLNNEKVNICTIEDPIEYGIEGINQTQINPNAGLVFANGLKSLLRQDPDIIMVGEIRDVETADLAINAAMTGHLVFSTLHTNNAFLAIQRLVEMGIQPFLAASVSNLIIGQRLVRKLCPSCKSSRGSQEKVIEKYGSLFDLEGVFAKLKRLGLWPKIYKNQTLKSVKFFHALGCPNCSETGYKGRVGIYEVLTIEENLYNQILMDSSQKEIKKQALKQDVLTMTEDGLLKVFSGRTTFEELIRVTKE